MKSYAYGSYPRSQRIAWLVVLAVAAGVTLVVGLWPGADLGAGYLAAGRSIRAAEARLAAENFRPPPENFAFDPNKVTAEELQRLGLSEKQAASWVKFRGGRDNAFRKPEDIGKLFVLSEEDKARLIPLAYVVERERKGARSSGSAAGQGFVFDPNTVSAGDLRRLGLSEKQARAFVNYRRSSRYGRAFKKPEDLRKIRTMSDAQKDHLARWAEIPPEPEETPVAAQRFRFDPNTIPEDSLVLLGFPRWQAKSFGKYRGGRPNTFRRPSDLRRVGALDSALVQEVIPYIDIAPQTNIAPAAAPRKNGTAGQAYGGTVRKALPPEPGSFDVNSGNLSAWKRLPGIGDYRAQRIVAHRNKFGGFYSLDQLAATPGLPDSTFQQILPYLTVGPVFRRIAINRATFEELKAHPNIPRNLANVIVKNREKFGVFRGPEDLRRIRLITDKNAPTILPYLSFE